MTPAPERTKAVSITLPTVVDKFVTAVNAGDLDALAALFADDAYFTAQSEARGIDAIRVALAREFINDHVTVESLDVTDHHGDFIVRTKFQGDYDKTNLPDPLIMTNYIAPRDGKIITLGVFFVPPAA
jgi:hypothetical protein